MPMMSVSQPEGMIGNIVPTAVTLPPPPPPPVSQPSGFALPTLDLTDFTLAYIEDFDRPVTEGPVTTDGSASPFDVVYANQPNNDLPGGIKTTIKTYPSTYFDTSKKGRYGGAIMSVAADSSILKGHVRFEAGWPRVFAWIPRLGNLLPGIPYGANDVLGGAFEIVWRCATLNSYKYVPLMWPRSNHRITADGVGADGELDFPEVNLYGNARISGFAHWQGDISGDSKTEQTSYTHPSIIAAGSGWHKTRQEWIPGTQSVAHPTRSIGGSVRYFIDDVLVKTITGSTDGVTGPFIPMNPMHHVVQQETALGGVTNDPSAVGDVEVDWYAFYSWNGTGA